MNYFTRQWWYIDSPRLEFDPYPVFDEYAEYVSRLAEQGVPLHKTLKDPCSLHDYELTRLELDKTCISLILRSPEQWRPFQLRFPNPYDMQLLSDTDESGLRTCDMYGSIGGAIGYSEYFASCSEKYSFFMILDNDLEIQISLSEPIEFIALDESFAGDKETSSG